jgi:predicted CoA-binding protein
MTDIYSLIPNFKKLMPDFLNKENIFVVYGADTDPKSLSFSVYKNLKKEGRKVFALDSGGEIDGDPVYSDINALPEKPNIACLVTKPDKTLEVLKKVINEGIEMIWIDLGSETSEVIEYCNNNDIKAIYYHSIIKELTNPAAEFLKDIGKEIS